MPALTTHPGTFSSDYLRFFKEIKAHNNKEWFAKNKERYEAVIKGPSLAFIESVQADLHKISKELVVDPRPVGGSFFRIYRDVRFSKDKSPYKTHAGLHFTHRVNDEKVHAPGFYLHLEPGDSGAWGGVWQPPTPDLHAIREAIADDPKKWAKLTKGFERHGDRLQRVPSGFDKDHPAAEELKWKDYLIGRSFTDAQVSAPDFRGRFMRACREMAPFNEFIAAATGRPW